MEAMAVVIAGADRRALYRNEAWVKAFFGLVDLSGYADTVWKATEGPQRHVMTRGAVTVSH